MLVFCFLFCFLFFVLFFCLFPLLFCRFSRADQGLGVVSAGISRSVRGHGENVRVLIDEAGAVVDLVVDNQVEILLGVVLGDLLEGEFLSSRHDELKVSSESCQLSPLKWS